jgi:hypothetical protein
LLLRSLVRYWPAYSKQFHITRELSHVNNLPNDRNTTPPKQNSISNHDPAHHLSRYWWATPPTAAAAAAFSIASFSISFRLSSACSANPCAHAWCWKSRDPDKPRNRTGSACEMAVHRETHQVRASALPNGGFQQTKDIIHTNLPDATP